MYALVSQRFRDCHFWVTCESDCNFWVTCESNCHFWVTCVSDCHFWVTCESDCHFWVTCDMSTSSWHIFFLSSISEQNFLFIQIKSDTLPCFPHNANNVYPHRDLFTCERIHEHMDASNSSRDPQEGAGELLEPTKLPDSLHKHIVVQLPLQLAHPCLLVHLLVRRVVLDVGLQAPRLHAAVGHDLSLRSKRSGHYCPVATRSRVLRLITS